ncbi:MULTISPECIES: MotA/TolQ/ExbB proton channel family protein [Chryseobacterium group]|uniref:MotA/TolQ/ExbB proton channel family protein n=1 Tax=Chryseobacterium group TaxID=2782232 RepID=UPI001A22E14B|nr:MULTISPECIES: MotA/TolQ/ExbB proton channel family protein [Chryseobacterium]MBH1958713.1 MotA/TolQ/ExbB proton channel family protein [Flavobacteriia bacterium]MBH2024675.1 MotA/TolQ/ExbB proton channel family protein [Flavobacteriales bacterium]MCP2037340.1 biopolymer transport protein ExbB [Chryseobacterium sp. HSC-36S06]UFK96764.1 MotA/TolQ/ExbB proton channel family protein [Chryseobacterium faecale]
MFLQTPTQVINTTTEKHVFSLWEILFSGGLLGNAIMISIFLLGILALYIFLERYFFIKRSSKETPNFLENIKDFVQEGKIQTAVDYCRTIDSPEARMIEKGLARIGRPISDISNAMQNQGQLEVSKLEKNLNILASASGAAPMLGFLGTVVGMIMAFFEISNVTGAVSPKLLASGIYTAMATTAVGLFVGIPAYFFYNILVTNVDRLVLKIQTHVNDFLDALNKPL